MKLAKGILFDLDQTLVNTSPAESCRNRKKWEDAYKKIPECSLFPGISELTQSLKSAGWKIGIVTSSPSKYAEKVIQHFDLRYDTLKCFHDTSRHKPHPDPYSVALEEMKVKRAFAWAVGDSQDDIDAANTLGIISIYARWGKPQEASPKNQCVNADLIFDEPKELGNYFLQQIKEVVEQQPVSKKGLSDLVKSEYGFQVSGGPTRFYEGQWQEIDYRVDCPLPSSHINSRIKSCRTFIRLYETTRRGKRYEQYYWAFGCIHCHTAFELDDISSTDKKNRPTAKDIVVIDGKTEHKFHRPGGFME